MGRSKSPIRPKPNLTPTRVALPPPPPGVVGVVPLGGGGGGGQTTITRSAVASDPNLLLDAFDTFTEHHTTKFNRRGQTTPTTTTTSENNKKTTMTTMTSSQKADPIVFLNQHFSTEAALVAQLPFIRTAVTERMQRLDDTISTALQRQSESAEMTQKHVQDAKSSVTSLEFRVRQVQQKAAQSEQTVREITKDMKRLDCAKRHLQKTMTTLKRLHMLIHAVEQLRLACLKEPFPDYKTASHLVDAIRLLLRHFEGYKVTPMELLSQKVNDLHGELKFCLIRAFRVVGFGIEMTIELEKDMKKTKYISLRELEDGEISNSLSVIMPPKIMADGIFMIDALGKEARNEFITVFGQDHLAEYSILFKPIKKIPKEQKRISSFKVVQPEESEKEKKPEYTLEFVEKRFLWFRTLLHSVGDKYPAVFPKYWNIEYLLTKTFLKRVSCFVVFLGGRRFWVGGVGEGEHLITLWMMMDIGMYRLIKCLYVCVGSGVFLVDPESPFGIIYWSDDGSRCQECCHSFKGITKDDSIRKGCLECITTRIWYDLS